MEYKATTFKGIYTNANTSTLSLEYCKDYDGIIDRVGLHGKGYKVEVDSSQSNNGIIVWSEEIMLDADKYTAIINDDGKYENTYVYTPKRYLAKVVLFDNIGSGEDPGDDQTRPPSTIVDEELQNVGDKLLEDKKYYLYVGDKEYLLQGRFVKAINHKGILYLLTTEGLTKLFYMNREHTSHSINDLLFSDLLYLAGDWYDNHFTYELVKTDIKQSEETAQVRITEYGNLSGAKFTVHSQIPIPPQKRWKAEFDIMDIEAGTLCGQLVLVSDFTEKEAEDAETIYYLNEVTGIVSNDLIQYFLNPGNGFGGDLAFFGNNLRQLIGIEFETTIVKKASELGFSPSINESRYMLTSLHDDGSEVVIRIEEIKNIDDKGQKYFYEVKKYAESFQELVKVAMKYGVIAFRIYLRIENGDYELVFQDDLFTDKIPSTYINILNLSGIYSTQTIGVSDPSQVVNSKIIKFQDFTFIEDLMIALSGESVLYPIIGNGKLSKVFYSKNIIPGISGKLLFNLNGNLGVSNNIGTSMIKVSSEDGLLFFSKMDDMGFIIKDEYDIAETPDGVILNTSEGIFVTNGSNMQMLSEPINNIVKDMTSSWIAYAGRKLFFRGVYKTKLKTFIFDFTEQLWASSSIAFKYVWEANDGTLYMRGNTSIGSIVKVPLNALYEGNLTCLDLPDQFKRIESIDFDMEGTISVEEDGRSTKYEIEGGKRGIVTHFTRLRKRYPLDLWSIDFLVWKDAIVYGIYVNFELENKLQKNRLKVLITKVER